MAKGAGGAILALCGIGLAVYAVHKLTESDESGQRPRPRPQPEPDELHLRLSAHLRCAANEIGVSPPPLLRSREVPNAASNGRAILYNDKWVLDTLARYCDDGYCYSVVITGVLVHELAHHVNRDVFRNHEHPHHQELRADYTAGLVLARLGFTPHDFERVLADLDQRVSATHPAGPVRVAAVRQGYMEARPVVFAA